MGADDEALDFPSVFASARDGWASASAEERGENLRPIFEAIVSGVPAAKDDPDAPLQMLITTLDSNDYVGRIGIGRVFAGRVRRGQDVALVQRDGGVASAKIVGLQRFDGLGRVDADVVEAGDLCALLGVEGIDIGDTVADPANPVALPPVTVDEPTITMVFRVNDSPMAGQEGEYVTSRQIRARLERELERNVALRVETGESGEEFSVSGRGLLHLGVLLETMRREGYEVAVGKPRVITKEIDGRACEPIERVLIDCPESSVGQVMELLGARRAELKHMDHRGHTTRLHFEAPSRGLIGVRSRLLTATRGEGVMSHVFERFDPVAGEIGKRPAGVLIATEPGRTTSYAVENLADRGVLFVTPGDPVYAGQIVGEHNRESDLPVNIVKEKKLDNMRAASKDATVTLKAPRRIELEAALEYIEDDELVEITPKSVRLRKRLLDENARKRASRAARSLSPQPA
jgi:GTP-binding protein